MPHVDKPSWIQHGGKSINSCDVSSDGDRIATAGSDGKVRIWTLMPILDHRSELDDKLPKKLATLTDHTDNDVNVVRFSPDGQYLATAGEDQSVLLYKRSAGQARRTFGTSDDGPNMENWKIVRTFRRHKLGVTGLAWSPDSTCLASCSLDTDVVIWDVVEGSVIAVLTAHTSFVKGVAWDPVGSYLATIGEDLTVRIWSTLNWRLLTRIRKNLSNMSMRTLFCRLSFSPLGDQLAIVNSTDGDLCTFMLSERQTWRCDTHCVGHEGTVVAARYAPRVFERPNTGRATRNGEATEASEAGSDQGPGRSDKEGDDVAMQYVAAGSQDKSLSVWVQGEMKPLFVLRRAFRDSISDLAWNREGTALLAVSLDGTALSVHFTEDEIGKALTEDKVDVLFQELYGDKNARNNVLPEYAEALCESGIEDSVDGGLDPFTSAATTPNALPSAPPSQHTGQYGAAGVAADDNGDVAMQTSPVALGAGGQEAPLDPPLGMADTAPGGAFEAQPQNSSDAAAVASGSQLGGEEDTTPVIRAKRRTSAAEPDPLAQPPAATVNAPGLSLDGVAEGSMPPGLLERLDPVGDAATTGAGAGARRKDADWEKATVAAKRARVTKEKDMPPPPPRSTTGPKSASKSSQGASAQGKDKAAKAKPAAPGGGHTGGPLVPLPVVQSEMVLAIPMTDAAPPQQAPAAGRSQPPVPERVITVSNSARTGNGAVPQGHRATSTVTCTLDGRQQWSTCCHSPVTLVAGGVGWVALALLDATLLLLSDTGRRTVPPLAMLAPVCLMSSCAGGKLVVLLANGNTRVWDVRNHKMILQTDARAVLRVSGSYAVSINLTANGLPYITLANSHAYMFHRGLEEWMRVADWGFPASMHHTCSPGATQEDIATLMSAAQRQRPMPAVFEVARMTPQQQEMDSCAHVESCLAAAEAAECPLDWSNFLVQYVTLLARQGDTARLDALCSSLLGPLSWKPSTQLTCLGPRSSWAGGHDQNAGTAAYGRGLRLGGGGDLEAGPGTPNASRLRQNGFSGTGECEAHDEDMDDAEQAAAGVDRPLLTVECHTRAVHSASAPAFQADCAGINDSWKPRMLGYDKRHVLEAVVIPLVLRTPSVSKVAVDFRERLKVARRSWPAQPNPSDHPLPSRNIYQAAKQ